MHCHHFHTCAPFVSCVFLMGLIVKEVSSVLDRFFGTDCMLKSFVVPHCMQSPHLTTLLLKFLCGLMGPGGSGRLALPQYCQNLSLQPPYDLPDHFCHKKVLERLIDGDKTLHCHVIFQYPCPHHVLGLILALHYL